VPALMRTLNDQTAERFARIALAHVEREYPNKLDHVINDPGGVRPTRELHPVFFGSFDWHSCVHGYWLLATLLRVFPEMHEAEKIEELFDIQLRPAKVRAEVRYLGQPLRGTFERPYGWAWLLMLWAELSRHSSSKAGRWNDALTPLAAAFSQRF